MKFFRNSLVIFILMIISVPTFSETVSEFALRCEQELNIPVEIPGFDCKHALPLQDSMFGSACDAKALLDGPECRKGQRLGKLPLGSDDIAGLYICRKYDSATLKDNEYSDIALIIHNKSNGKTCFFQSHLGGSKHNSAVPSPRSGSGSNVWRNQQPDGCTRCHVNDPFIMSPHVAHAFDKLHVVGFNALGSYSSLKMDSNALHKTNRKVGCARGCHYRAKLNFEQDALSKHWMPNIATKLWDTKPTIKRTPADLAVFRQYKGKGLWRFLDRTTGRDASIFLGAPGDVPISADYDGDGQSDFAVWSPSGLWSIISSSTGSTRRIQWGIKGDRPVPADYTDDGRDDLAFWRPSNGRWYVVDWKSFTGLPSTQWGEPGDIPVPADYDGDYKADKAVWRPSNGTWYGIHSSSNTRYRQQWGQAGDIPVTGDFTGDGRADRVVWRPSNGVWYVLNSANNSRNRQQWGINGDVPVTGDYDGDGKQDYAVYRPNEGRWYYRKSSTNTGWFRNWGIVSDQPQPMYRTP